MTTSSALAAWANRRRPLRFFAFLCRCLLLVLLLPHQGRAEQNTITGYETITHADRLEVRIMLSTSLAEQPVAFLMATPPGLIIDFPDTGNTSGLRRKRIDVGPLREIAIATVAERSRVVLKLGTTGPYALRMEATTVIIEIANTPADALPTKVERPGKENSDGQNGPQSAGHRQITLHGAETTLDARQQDRKIVADIHDTKLPGKASSHFDVNHARPPADIISAHPHNRSTSLIAETNDTVAHHLDHKVPYPAIKVSAQQPLTVTAENQPRLYYGDKLSLQFQSVSVRALLQVLADFTGINIIASDSVGGTLTLRLKDVPWDQALEVILQARDLEMRRRGNVMWIAPREEVLAKERQELEQRARIAELEPLRADVFQLNYQKAEVFRDVFGNVSGSQPGERKHGLLSRRGSAVVDQRTNQLFVTDTSAVLDNIRALLKKIDVAARQVLIEVRIVEADDSFSRNLGVRLGFSARNNGAAIGNLSLTGAEPGSPTLSTAPAPGHLAVNLPAASIGGSAAGNFALSLFNAGANRFLDLELSALEADGKGKIISSPRVVTADQQAALIEQGEEIPYQQSTSSGATSTAFKKANLKLEVTPQIAPNGSVILSVDINKDSRGTVTPGGLAINTKHVKTLVQVDNGGTVVIGGIYTQTVTDTVTKIPLLGDIPLLGGLFRNTARINNKTELLIFLTPKIIEEHDARD